MMNTHHNDENKSIFVRAIDVARGTTSQSHIVNMNKQNSMAEKLKAISDSHKPKIESTP